MKNRIGSIVLSVYGIIVALAMVLMLVLTFVDIAGTSPLSELDVAAAHEYVKDLSDEPHPNGYWNPQTVVGDTLDEMLGYTPQGKDFQRAHEENRQYIVDELVSFGLGSAVYTDEVQAEAPEVSGMSVRKLLDGVDNITEENAHNIPNDKFRSDLFDAYNPEDTYYDEMIAQLKREYVQQYLEATASLATLKSQAASVEKYSDEYYLLSQQATSLFYTLYETTTGTYTVKNTMPQFGAQISPFVIEYDRYITDADAVEYDVASGSQAWELTEPNRVYKYVRNIIAYFPSEETVSKGDNTTADIVAFVCHYDSVSGGPGAVDDNAALGGLLSAAKTIASNYKAGKNDICFIFTDAEEYGLWGIQSMYSLKSMGDFFNRLGLIFNFEARGTSGTVAMFETSQNNGQLVNAYASSGANNTTYASSLATFIYTQLSNTTDMEFILDVQKNGQHDAAVLNFANIGSCENYHTINDSYENMAGHISAQVGTVALRGVSAFKDYDLSKLNSDSDAVFFSYYDLGIIRYSPVFGYILAIIGLLLLGAVIFFNIKKKSFSWINVAKGGVAQVAAIVVCAVIFFLVGLLTYAIGSGMVLYAWEMFELMYTYSNIWIILAAAVVAAVASYFVYKLMAKLLKISGADTARSGNIIILLIGVVLSFALPSAGYLFMIPAVLALAVMLAELLFKDMFQRKTGHSWDALRLYTLPFILCVFLPLSISLMVTEALGHLMYAVVGLFLALMLGTFLPQYRIKDQLKSISSGFKKEAQEQESAV